MGIYNIIHEAPKISTSIKNYEWLLGVSSRRIESFSEIKMFSLIVELQILYQLNTQCLWYLIKDVLLNYREVDFTAEISGSSL